ncbi:MAG: FumA C-terminus/TtdB family hydratase beta subunit [Clostridiales bacterium]|jgi:fumarate hydratase subunit beta|nr:FumA C-terminus/TtdB family hydratase beta subunit [Clostridiales bacterium]
METAHITAPFSDEVLRSLTVGQKAYITGDIYTARDAAHKRMFDMLKNGEKPPFEYAGAAVYYAGPCPNKPGRVIGSIGPTTSGRMDAYSPALIAAGLKVMIGKGTRSKEVMDAIKKYGGVYFAAIGGAGTLLAQCVTAVETIAFAELGTEAARKLTVKNFPVIVAADSFGRNIYERV